MAISCSFLTLMSDDTTPITPFNFPDCAAFITSFTPLEVSLEAFLEFLEGEQARAGLVVALREVVEALLEFAALIAPPGDFRFEGLALFQDFRERLLLGLEVGLARLDVALERLDFGGEFRGLKPLRVEVVLNFFDEAGGHALVIFNLIAPFLKRGKRRAGAPGLNGCAVRGAPQFFVALGVRVELLALGAQAWPRSPRPRARRKSACRPGRFRGHRAK